MAFTLATKNGKRTSTSSGASTREESEFDGLWINVGVTSAIEGAEDGETKFIRLPRGIAVSDLADHKVYANTNPDWAAEATLANGIMDVIRQAGLELEEGESIPLQLHVQLYKRQEQVEQAPASADTADLRASIIG